MGTKRLKETLIIGALGSVVLGLMIGMGLIFATSRELMVVGGHIPASGLLTKQLAPVLAGVLGQGIIMVALIVILLTELKAEEDPRASQADIENVLKVYQGDYNALILNKLGILKNKEVIERNEQIFSATSRLIQYIDACQDPVFLINDQHFVNYSNQKQSIGKDIQGVIKYSITGDEQLSVALKQGVYGEAMVYVRGKEHKLMSIPMRHKGEAIGAVILLREQKQGGDADREKRMEIARKEKISIYINELNRLVGTLSLSPS